MREVSFGPLSSPRAELRLPARWCSPLGVTDYSITQCWVLRKFRVAAACDEDCDLWREVLTNYRVLTRYRNFLRKLSSVFQQLTNGIRIAM